MQDNKIAKKPLSPAANVISLITSATISGIPADILSFPFCRVKTVMMTQVGKNMLSLNTYQTVHMIYKNQGLFGFYRGFMPLLTSAIPGTALFFGGVQGTQAILGESAYSAALAGFVGQMTGSIVWVPAEILKELRQMTATTPTFQKKTVLELTKDIYKQEGFKGLYRGFFPQFLSFGPFNSIGLSMSVALHNQLSKEDTTTLHSIAINGASFGTGALLTTPIDVVKTRIQVAAADPVRFPDRSIFSCTVNIIKNEGAHKLFAGAAQRVAWLGLRQSVAFTFFGKVNAVCNDYLSDNEELAIPKY